jgi:hypothetical protein
LNLPGRYSQTINVAAMLGRQAADQAIKAKLQYRAFDSKGKLLTQGQLDAQGNTQPIFTATPEKIQVTLAGGDWVRATDTDHA